MADSPTRLSDGTPPALRSAASTPLPPSSSSSRAGSKKRNRPEELPVDLFEEEQTIIHSPTEQQRIKARSPTSGQLPPEKAAKRKGSRSPTGSRDNTPKPPAESRSESTESGEEKEQEDEGVNDLLKPLKDYDWAGFMKRFQDGLGDIGAEEEKLFREHEMWEFMYKIWAASRSRSDGERLSQEMATIIAWTKLQEAELEQARISHTESMLAISTVLAEKYEPASLMIESPKQMVCSGTAASLGTAMRKYIGRTSSKCGGESCIVA